MFNTMAAEFDYRANERFSSNFFNHIKADREFDRTYARGWITRHIARFFPQKFAMKELSNALQQKQVEIGERTNRWLPLVSNLHRGALPIFSDAQVFSGFIEAGKQVNPPYRFVPTTDAGREDLQRMQIATWGRLGY